jgi:exodeoxyribonuclease VII small subunit
LVYFPHFSLRRAIVPKPANNQEAPTFEGALAELERIVARMEAGQLPLEQALAAYKRGAELLKFCQDKLADAQQQIKVLEGDTLKDFEAGDDAA